MSEARDLNESSSPDPTGSEGSNGEPRTNEIESLLRSLVPRRPDIDRDVLFFQAGLAVARRGSTRGLLVRALWPAVAASLLVACGGLAVELGRKSTALEAALAAAASGSAGTIAAEKKPPDSGASETDPQVLATTNPAMAVAENRIDSPLRSRGADDVLSRGRLPGRQLTVHGWVEAPPGSPVWEFESAPPADAEPAVPRFPRPNYLELLRSEKG